MSVLMNEWQDSLRRAAREAHHVESVIAPLDGSDAMRAALPIARTLAVLESAMLHVTCLTWRQLPTPEMLQELGIQADDIKGAVLDSAMGAPEDGIRRSYEALPSPLLVMATHSRDEPIRGALGRVAEAILSTAPARIVLVPSSQGERPWTLRRILLAHDGTPTSDLATAPAAGLALRASAEVVALHVAARRTSRPVEPGSLPAPRYIDQPQHEWPAWAEAFVGRMMALGAPPAAVNFNLLVTGGQPGSEIAQFARDRQADLVVMAWHGRWRPHRTGALKTVIRRSGCPVLLICGSPTCESSENAQL